MVSTQQLPKVRDVDLAFGSTVWLPVPEVIPKEFWHENQYSRFMDGWFFDGLTEKSLKNIILSDSLSSEEAGERGRERDGRGSARTGRVYESYKRKQRSFS